MSVPEHLVGIDFVYSDHPRYGSLHLDELGDEDISLVFLPVDLALDMDRIHTVLLTASTVSQLRDGLTDEEFEELVSQCHDRLGEALDWSGAAPSPVHAAGLPDPGEYWPPWPMAGQIHWVPAGIAAAWGTKEIYGSEGVVLHLPIERERDIVASFHRHGYHVRRDDELVARANFAESDAVRSLIQRTVHGGLPVVGWHDPPPGGHEWS